jgi:hypothetical protein
MRRLACLSLAALAAATPAAAQDFKRVVPKLPPAPAPAEVRVPDQAPPPVDDQTVLVPELKGVVFVNGIAAVRPVTDMPGGLAAPDLPLLQTPEFAARVRS